MQEIILDKVISIKNCKNTEFIDLKFEKFEEK